MKSKLLAVALGLAFLSGCQTQTVEEMSYTQRKELAGVIAKRCVDQGYTEKSPEFVPCIKAETEGEIARRRRASARVDMEAANRVDVTCRPFFGAIRCN